ncbi:MAG TPA: 6,7-dimethyl-8-ribityllumazine synthase, partial [Gemmataceae bacterium]|nr:6,7-dimethyl-8-ribityllumazine synthase [Gemmataceae bacterium]
DQPDARSGLDAMMRKRTAGDNEHPRVTNIMMRLVVIAADFNKDIVGPMIEAARQEIEGAGAVLHELVTVPGCYEIPLVAARCIAQPAVDGLVILGYIERGETLHGEVMGHVVHRALVELQFQLGKPMGLGIIGPGATPEQAMVRKADYARAAVRAVLRVGQLLKNDQ